MKGIAIWLLKKVYGIDVDSLRSDNKSLREENGRHVSRNNSLKRDKKSLSEKIMRLEDDNSAIQNINQELKPNCPFEEPDYRAKRRV